MDTEAISSQETPRHYRWAPWFLLLLVLAMTLPGTDWLPLVDRDEPRFATATREMMERHDWIVPTFNAEAEGIRVDDIIKRVLEGTPKGEAKAVL